MRAWRNAAILLISVLITVACATTGPRKSTTLETLAGTRWEGIWGSEGGHGMRNPVGLSIEQADLGTVAGILTITDHGQNYRFSANGLITTKDGSSLVSL